MTCDPNPHIEYTNRLEARKRTVQRYERTDRNIAAVRFFVAIAFVTAAMFSIWRGEISAWWMALPLGAFIALVVVHDRVIRAKARAQKAVTFYEDGLARIEDRWMGRGQFTGQYVDDSHLYGPDLDIFGKGSLFELLCTARTRPGEHTLARWLSEPAERPEILARQAAIEELRLNLDLREDLAILGSAGRGFHPDTIVQWAESPILLKGNGPRIVGAVLTVLVIVTLIGVLIADGYWMRLSFYGALLLEAVFGLLYRSRVHHVFDSVEGPQRELSLLSDLVNRIELESFQAAKLARLRSSFDAGGLSASRRITQLERTIDLAQFKQLDGPVAIGALIMWNIILIPMTFLLWKTQLGFSMESWRRQFGPAIEGWLHAAGEIEALCSLAGYAYEHPADPFPEISETGPLFDGRDLCHPLIPATQCVPNSVRLGNGAQLLVISGSNMSGKSTLLRTVGVNTVLALAGAPVRAKSLRLSPLAIGATIRIQDSLQSGTSRFYSEILRIRHITDLTAGPLPALFLLDELLHGTNSHDRTLGGEGIVKGLLRRGAIGLATTHDLALARIAEGLAPLAANVHFQDELRDGHMVFDYKMRPGVVEKSNALELIRAVGLEIEEPEPTRKAK